MKKTGLYYAANTKQTAQVAKLIVEAYGSSPLADHPFDDTWEPDFEGFDNLIIGASTWFDGELPTYWDELLPALESLDFSKKKVAIFGLGDQEGYSENFADGVGILAETLEKVGATLVGFTSTDGYTFESSRAVRDGKFLGLIIDQDTQKDKTHERVSAWVEQLKEAFK